MKKIFVLFLLIFITNISFANDNRQRFFIGINGTGLNVIGVVFEYSFGNSFSIVNQIHFNNPVGAEFGLNIFIRYYFIENMDKLYLDLGIGYFGNFISTNCLILEPRLGWRFSIETKLENKYLILEPHLGYPFIIPINNQYNLPDPPNILSIYGILGIIAGIKF